MWDVRRFFRWFTAVGMIGAVGAACGTGSGGRCDGPSCGGSDAAADTPGDVLDAAFEDASDGSDTGVDASADVVTDAVVDVAVDLDAADAADAETDANPCGDPGDGVWNQVGGPLSWVPGNTASQRPSIRLDSDVPVVAWIEPDGPESSPKRVYVARWSGTTWMPVGGALNSSSTSADWPSLGLRSDGSPIVAWYELNTVTADVDVFVHAWSTGAWAPLSGPLSALPPKTQTSTPHLVVGPNDVPVVAWGEYTGGVGKIYSARWNGSSWQMLGSGLSAGATSAEIPSLQIFQNGDPVVAWQEGASGSRKIYVATYTAGVWNFLGSAQFVAAEAFSPEIAVGSNDGLVLAWVEGYEKLYVRRWNGSAWVSLGAELPVPGGVSPQLLIALAAHGTNDVLVAWRGFTNTVFNGIYVHRWDGSSWKQLGLPLTNGGSSHPAEPAMALDGCGRPVVAFEQPDSTGTTQVYVFRFEK
jgi:hypothetical protein